MIVIGEASLSFMAFSIGMRQRSSKLLREILEFGAGELAFPVDRAIAPHPDERQRDRGLEACSKARSWLFRPRRRNADWAILSVKSAPVSIWIWAWIQSATALSQSSPPRCVSPEVAKTWKVPSPISRIETSRVPPPRSKTKTFLGFLGIEAIGQGKLAVGSLMMRTTSRPAIVPASLVA
jgi:hypothetical protein